MVWGLVLRAIALHARSMLRIRRVVGGQIVWAESSREESADSQSDSRVITRVEGLGCQLWHSNCLWLHDGLYLHAFILPA